MAFFFFFFVFVRVGADVIFHQLVASNARFHACIANPDQYIYQSAKANAGGSQDAVLLVNDDSAAGRFNRAQRGIANTQETQYFALICYVCALLVAPKTATIAIGVYALGRVIFVTGYEHSAPARLMGMLVSVVLCCMYIFSFVIINFAVSMFSFVNLKISNMFGMSIIVAIVHMLALRHLGLLQHLPAFLFVPNAFQ